MSHLLDVDPATGSQCTFHEEGQELVITNSQDVTAILAANQEARKNRVGRSRSEVANWVARIPNVTYWDLWTKGIIQDKVAFDRWLNQSENAVFRTNTIYV